MTLKYSVIRFSPRPGRGEVLNIGIIVIDPVTNEGRVQLSTDRHRLRLVGDRELIDETFRYLNDWKDQIEGDADNSSDLTEEALLTRSAGSNNLLHFSVPAPILVSKLDQAIEVLGKDFLPQEREARTYPSITRRRAVSAIREAYKFQGLERWVDFVERVEIRTKNYKELMDFAVTNGKAVQIAQSWNFQQRSTGALSEAVKAWAWTVQDIRDKGGSGHFGNRSFAVPKDVDVEAVYIEPDDSAGAEVLAEALHAFREIGAKHGPMGRADAMAARASKALGLVAN